MNNRDRVHLATFLDECYTWDVNANQTSRATLKTTDLYRRYRQWTPDWRKDHPWSGPVTEGKFAYQVSTVGHILDRPFTRGEFFYHMAGLGQELGITRDRRRGWVGLTPRPLVFTEWLARQAHRDDTVGDLARDWINNGAHSYMDHNEFRKGELGEASAGAITAWTLATALWRDER